MFEGVNGTATRTAAAWEARIDELATRLMISGFDAAMLADLQALAEAAEAEGQSGPGRVARELASALEKAPEEAQEGLIKEGFTELRSAFGQEGKGAGAPAAPAYAALGDDAELVADFLVEAREHLSQIEGQMLVLERDPSAMEVIHAVFRAFHTIKGLAGFLGFSVVQAVSHEVETLLDLARNEKLVVDSAIVDGVLESGDFLLAEMVSIDRVLAGGAPQIPADHQALVARIQALAVPRQAAGLRAEVARELSHGEHLGQPLHSAGDEAESFAMLEQGAPRPVATTSYAADEAMGIVPAGNSEGPAGKSKSSSSAAGKSGGKKALAAGKVAKAAAKGQPGSVPGPSPGQAVAGALSESTEPAPLPVPLSFVAAARDVGQSAAADEVVPRSAVGADPGVDDRAPKLDPRVVERAPLAGGATVPGGNGSAGPGSSAATVGKAGDVQRNAEPGKAPDASSVRVETAKLDHLMDMVGEMVIAQSLIRHSQVLLTANDSRLIGDLSQLARVTAEVQRATMSMRMVPVGQLFQKIERIIRDLSRKAGKQVVLETSGIDTEVDKTVAEELSDPLLHMVRNSVDHGTEPAAERIAAGKDPVARIRLAAYHQGGQVVIQIADDGRGLNAEKIRKKAEQRELISPSAQLTEAETYQLIFEPGFSTAEKITDVSGRGVGMDVVRRNVEKLRGRIETQSTLGRGTTFLLKLPLTLAIIDGLVVEVGANRYIIPLSVVREIFRPLDNTLFTVEGRDEMVLVREQLLPIVRLDLRLGVEGRALLACDGLLVVIESENKRFCLLVDDLLGKQEVVIKALGETFKDVTGFSGCAVLGDGRVGLILDTDGLYRGRRR